MIKTVAIILFSNFICFNCQTPDPVVVTSYGPVRGSFKQIEGRPQRYIVSFLGIPYAEPPIRGYRFRDPQPLRSWYNERVADKRVSCPQIGSRFRLKRFDESEDCLYLNIFYPFENVEPSNLPVLVYFHGGEFNFGSKDHYEPDILLREKNIVLVTVNYRLGVFGFLSTNDENIPGNFGIKDQIAALKFVQNEIYKFKGDNTKITIFGHDAGAISVDIHRILPERITAKFSASISSGGTLFTPWALQHEPYENAIWLAGNMSCSTRTDKILYCLQQKTKEELISAQLQHNFKFRPSIDRNSYDALLRDEPLKLYQSADFKKHRHLFGLTSKEGALDVCSRYSEYNYLPDDSQKIKLLLERYFKPYTNTEAITALVHYKYMGHLDTRSGAQTQTPLDTEALAKMLGSYLYESPTDKSMRMIASRGVTASLYVFQFKGPKTFGTLLEPQSQLSRDLFGVTHGDDIFSIFKMADDQAIPNLPYITLGIINCLYDFMTNNGVSCQRNYYNQESSTVYSEIDAPPNPVERFNFRPNEDTRFWNELVFDIERLTSTRLPYFDYNGYSSYRTATWSLFAFIVVIILFVVCFIAFIIYKRRKDKTSLEFLKKRDKELEERYNFL